MHNAGAGFIIFLLADPHLLEGGQRGKDGTSDPDAVFPLGRSDDLDLNGLWGQSRDLLLHAVSDAYDEKNAYIIIYYQYKQSFIN